MPDGNQLELTEAPVSGRHCSVTSARSSSLNTPAICPPTDNGTRIVFCGCGGFISTSMSLPTLQMSVREKLSDMIDHIGLLGVRRQKAG